MKNERIEDLLPIYALGGLSIEDAVWVEEQISADPRLMTELEQLQAVADMLPLAAQPLEPSAEAEAALFARIEADMAGEAAAAAPAVAARPAPAAAPAPGLWEQLKALFSSPVLSGAALTFAAVLLVWAFSLLAQVQNLNQSNDALISQANDLHAQVDALAATNDDLVNEVNNLRENNGELQVQVDEMAALTVSYEAAAEENEAALAALAAERSALEAEIAALTTELELAAGEPRPFSSSTMYAVTIPGTELQPAAEAQLVVDPETQTAMLVVSGMNDLPENSVYQVLLIRGAEHETAETFRVNTEGEGVLLVNSPEPLDSFDAVGVSIEPQGGSAQRTGDIVLLGSLIN